MESPKVLNQPATPILIFFLTVSLMVSVSLSQPYDYLQYVVQWQPAVCSNPNRNGEWCTKSPNQSFTIHGLWPSNSNGGYVTCPGREPAFDINEVQPILAKLDECWPNMFNSNAVFWDYEWQKHGRCSLHVLRSQFDYFDRAVALCNKYNKRIKDILSEAQIYPTNDQMVKRSDIAYVIRKEFGSWPALRCSNGTKQLKEVILCLNVAFQPLKGCPWNIDTCPYDILFLSEAIRPSNIPDGPAVPSPARSTRNLIGVWYYFVTINMFHILLTL